MKIENRLEASTLAPAPRKPDGGSHPRVAIQKLARSLVAGSERVFESKAALKIFDV
jgi:hypothetical protein